MTKVQCCLCSFVFPFKIEMSFRIYLQVADAILGLSVKKMNSTMPRDAEKKVEPRALGSRKALQDITNTSSLGQRAATKKNLNVGNVVEEGFLHDHNKCTAAQKVQMDHDLYNALLSEHGERSLLL